MLRNYLTTALRIMLRQQGFTIINISGLTVGIACCLVLILYIQHELDYDRFHTDADLIYRVGFKGKLQDNRFNSAETGAPLASNLSQNPAVDRTLRLANWPTFPVRYRDKTFTEPYLLIADSNFFSFFNFELVEGNRSQVLKNKDALVISESAARKYFDYKGPGDKSPIGKKLSLAQGYAATIAGIAKDAPANSHFHFSLILSMASWSEVEKGGWLDRLVITYFKLKPRHALREVENQFTDIVVHSIMEELKKKNQDTFDFTKQGNYLAFFAQPITSIHLHSWLDDEIESNGNIQYIYLFGAIALFITLLACINFMNLSTARASARSKEVGVRKTVGAVQRRIIFQFLLESYLYTGIAVALALLLAWISLLPFNLITGKNLSITLFLKPLFALGLLAFALLTGAIAGSYPAFYLSFFGPTDILRAQLRSKRKIYGVRNILVVFQFVISIALIIATWMTYRQQQHIRHLEAGFDTSNVVNLLHTANLKEKAEDFKKELLTHPEIVSAGYANRLPPNVDWQYLFRIKGQTRSNLFTVYEMDEDHLKTMGYTIHSGRFFDKGNPSDTNAVLLNETAMRKAGIKEWKDIVISSSYDQDTAHHRKLIGIVNDFHFRSLQDSIEPLAIVPRRKPLEMAIRITEGDREERIKLIQRIWISYVPDAPFEYSFVDQNFNSRFESARKTGQVFMIFTVLAIFIACLGLFGLATHATHQRSREIGIRKSMGASPYQIVMLLTRDFARLIIVAFLIAAPIAWIVIDRWFDHYAYRIPVSVSVVLLSGSIALTTGLVTVSLRAWKAANANPVKALRNE